VLTLPLGQLAAPAIAPVLSFWLAQMREDGTLDRLRARYFPPHSDECSGNQKATTQQLTLPFVQPLLMIPVWMVIVLTAISAAKRFSAVRLPAHVAPTEAPTEAASTASAVAQSEGDARAPDVVGA